MDYAAEYRRLTDLIEHHRTQQTAVARERDDVVIAMLADRTQQQVAGELGITQPRVAQILTRVRNRER